MEEDGWVSLELGWPIFAERLGLHAGFFLQFCYCGRNRLSIKVFDGTLCRCRYHRLYDSESDDSD